MNGYQAKNVKFVEFALLDISYYMKYLLNVRFIISSLKRYRNE